MQLTVNVAFTYVYRHVSIGSGIPTEKDDERSARALHLDLFNSIRTERRSCLRAHVNNYLLSDDRQLAFSLSR